MPLDPNSEYLYYFFKKSSYFCLIVCILQGEGFMHVGAVIIEAKRGHQIPEPELQAVVNYPSSVGAGSQTLVLWESVGHS